MSHREPRRARRSVPSRTPLFGALRQVARLAGRTDGPDGPALDEILDQGRERAARWTRREVLKASAAMLALGAVPTRAAEDRPPGPTRAAAPRIAVVGAGIAGLNVAFELKKAGHRARVYEAGRRVGGRILTVAGVVAPGLITEMGGEFIDSSHDDMLALVKELGLELVDTRDARVAERVRETYFFDGIHYTPGQAVEAFRPLAGRIRKDADRLGPRARYRVEPGARALDRVSIAEYLDTIGASGWIRDLIAVAYGCDYGLDIDQLSSINLLAMISTDLGEGRLNLYDSDERYLVRGGSGRVVDALARRLGGSVPILLEHRLESVRAAGDALRLDFAGPGGRAVGVEADFVVLALPFSVLRGVDLRVELPPEKVRAIAELGYGTNTKIVAGFRRRAWRDLGYSGRIFSDEPFGTAWDHSRLQGGEAGGLTLFPGGRAGVAATEGTVAEQAERLLRGVERAFPGAARAANGRAARSSWLTDPLALGSYACYKTGQWTTIAGTEAAPVGNLYFAGEHCHTFETGYMNSGVASGRATARALLARLDGH